MESTLLWKTEEEKHICLIFFMENVIEFETLCLHDKFLGFITTFWTKFGIQYAPSPAKLQIKLFLFKSHSRSWPFQGIPVSHSHSQNSHLCSCYQISGMWFLIPVPIPKKVGDVIFHSHSRYQNLGMGWVIPVPIPKIQKVIPVHPNVAKNAENYHKLHKFLKVAQSCHKLQIGFKSCQ